FDEIPMPVTAEVYPFFPATQITHQALSINGVEKSFTSVSGQNPTWLQFKLGGDPNEIPGGINTLTVSVSDNAGSTTHFILRYFRLAGGSVRPAATSTSPRVTQRPATGSSTTTTTLRVTSPVTTTSTSPYLTPTPSIPLTTTKRHRRKGRRSRR